MEEIKRKLCILVIATALKGKDKSTLTDLDVFLKDQVCYIEDYKEDIYDITTQKDTLEVHDQLDNRCLGRIRKI